MVAIFSKDLLKSEVKQAQTSNIVVDHNSVALFEQIPDQYLEAARNTRLLFVDRSVGSNINDGLNCLAHSSYAAAPSGCRRGVTSTEYQPGPRYDRSRWEYAHYGHGGWSDNFWAFVDMVNSRSDGFDVFNLQASYLTVAPDSGIVDPTQTDYSGYFVSRTDQRFPDVYDHEEVEQAHPTKTFIYATSSLARSIGSPESERFNQLMRRYAQEHNKPLFDIADIESHTPQGQPCYDNRDGVEYCQSSTRCENYPDDSLNLAAICQDYTTEINGGHLSNPGRLRVAKAFWVLIAQLAGWDPGVATPTLAITPTPTPTVAPTPPSFSEPTSYYWLPFDDPQTPGNPCANCVVSNTTFIPNGITNGAYDFNGTSSYIYAGKWTNIQGQDKFSLTVWVRPDFEENYSVRTNLISDGSHFHLFSLPNIRGWRSTLRLPSGMVRVDASNLNWDPGTWHQIAVTYDNTNFKIYWDGQLKQSKPATGTIVSDNTDTYLGMIFNTYFYDGAMDELKIYNTALTASQIQSAYSSGQ
jgi:hypothetical protein